MFSGRKLCLFIFSMILISVAWAEPTLPTPNTLPKPKTLPKTEKEAAANQEETLKKNLAASGVTFSINNKNMEIVIDAVKTLNTIPKLQELGYINKNIKQADVTRSPIILTFMIGMLFTAVIVHHEYVVNNNMDAMKVKAYMLIPDKKGKNIKQACYSFDFNRAIFNKVNWNGISEGGFAKVSRNFALSEWCYKVIAAEKKKKK